jgi:glycosyltransferase involved in cell wall biosynthesis
MRKKRILLVTDFTLAKTGFARASRELLSYLYLTHKYDIVHACTGMAENAQQLENTSWLSLGVVPTDPDNQQKMQQDPGFQRAAAYGSVLVDKYIEKYKPDCVFLMNDQWGVDYALDKNWFDKLNTVLTITLDSLPILPTAIKAARKAKNYWSWASFATEEMHKMGLTHVKTVHGPLSKNQYYKLPDEKIKELRKKNNISDDCFVAVFSSRNQLRKLFPNAIQGWKIFRDRNPELKNAKLLFHTFLGEGWQLMSLAKEYGVDPKDILVTYVCRNCHEYQIKSPDDRQTPHEVDEQGRPKIDKDGNFIEKPIVLHDKDCPFCGAQKAQISPSVGFGVDVEQMNEIFNIATVGLQLFTSGAQELAAQEIALCEKILIATDYSCGTDICHKDAYTLPVESSYYFEHGTEFRKASAIPSSIAKQLTKVYKMTPADRKKWGERARQYIIDHYDIEVIGKVFEDFIDNAPFVDENDPKNFAAGEEREFFPHAQLPPVNSDEEFIRECYHRILSAVDVEASSPDLQNWLSQMKNGLTRNQLEQTFRNIAMQEVQKKQKVTIEDLLDKNGKKRYLMCLKDSAGDLLNASSLLESWRENHPENEWDLYFSCSVEYFSLLEGNPYIHKLLPFQPIFLNELACVGVGKQKGYFDEYCNLGVQSQQVLNYVSREKVGLELKG